MRLIYAILLPLFCISCQKKWTKDELLPQGHDVWVGDEFFVSLKNGEEYSGVCVIKDEELLIFRRTKKNSPIKWEPYGEIIKVPWESVSSISSSQARPEDYLKARDTLLNERKQAYEKNYQKMGGSICFVRLKLKNGILYDPVFTISLSDWKLGLRRARELDVGKLYGDQIEVDWEDIDSLEVLAGPDGRPIKQ